MPFLQIIEGKTSNIEQLQELDGQWEKATEGKRPLRRSFVVRDRNEPDRHMILAFFHSYEAAMENSNLPATQEFAKKQAALIDGPMTFRDFDVIDERS